jgi:chemotaxis protein methyltransferase WspC
MGLADIENLLKETMGLNVASIGSPAVARAVQQRLSACHIGDLDAYWNRVRASETELQELIEAVVVPETWFFRDRESFTAVARLVRDEWLSSPRHDLVRLLSLPCSTGEEPYSMAMALLDAGVPAHRFQVEAVDISARLLAHAGLHTYGKNSFRGQDLAFRDRHFGETPHGYRLSEAVCQQVRFQQGNLFDGGFLPGVERFEVIFCRNVLIYFDRPTQDRVILVLKRLLTINGVLVVAPSETALASSHGLVPTNLPLAFAFRNAGAVPGGRKPRAADPIRPPSIGRSVRRTPSAPHGARATSATRTAVPGAPRPAGKPPDLTADIGEATRLADQGHFVEAATCCEAHLSRHGPSATAFYLLGLVRDATGNLSDAVTYYRKALYLDPNHCDAQIHLAFLMEQQGDLAGAQVLRNRARRTGPHAKKVDD